MLPTSNRKLKLQIRVKGRKHKKSGRRRGRGTRGGMRAAAVLFLALSVATRPLPHGWDTTPMCAEEESNGGDGSGAVGGSCSAPVLLSAATAAATAAAAAVTSAEDHIRAPRCAAQVVRSVLHRSMDPQYVRHPNAVAYQPLPRYPAQGVHGFPKDR